MEIKIYTTEDCPYCRAAKEFLKQKGLSFEEILLKDRKEFDDLIKRTGQKTVPQIFMDGKLIGGFDDLKKMDSEGKL